jgi:DnaJ-class molecular chaperone
VRAAARLSIGEDFDGVLVRLRDAFDAIATPAVREAASMHCSDDIEIDSDAGTSPSDDGTWVQAWVWVPYPDCETCDGGGKDEQDQDCPDCGGTGKGTIG